MDANEILLSAIERIERRVESIDSKLDSKVDRSTLEDHTKQDMQDFATLNKSMNKISIRVAVIVTALVASGIVGPKIASAIFGL